MLPRSIRQPLEIWADNGMPDDQATRSNALEHVLPALWREYLQLEAFVAEVGEKGLHTPSECPAGVGHVEGAGQVTVYVLAADGPDESRVVAVFRSLEAAQKRAPGNWRTRPFELFSVWDSETHSIYGMEVRQ